MYLSFPPARAEGQDFAVSLGLRCKMGTLLRQEAPIDLVL